MGKEYIEESNQLMLQFSKRGGIAPVIVQEMETRQVLMLGWINQIALQQSIETRLATFWSTSRNELWVKGKTSGNYMSIEKILIDCDQDAVLYLVNLKGKGICHTLRKDGTNRKACFYREIDLDSNELKFINGEQ